MNCQEVTADLVTQAFQISVPLISSAQCNDSTIAFNQVLFRENSSMYYYFRRRAIFAGHSLMIFYKFLRIISKISEIFSVLPSGTPSEILQRTLSGFIKNIVECLLKEDYHRIVWNDFSKNSPKDSFQHLWKFLQGFLQIFSRIPPGIFVGASLEFLQKFLKICLETEQVSSKIHSEIYPGNPQGIIQ